MDERAWRYRKTDGELESKLFESGADEALNDGWFDSPDKVEETKKRKYNKKTEDKEE